MPTARELLEEADALMRRNRLTAADDIPVLTDAVTASAIEHAPPRARGRLREPTEPARAMPDLIPTLTDSVAAAATADAVTPEGEPSDWLDFDEAQPSIIGDAPDSIAIVPPVELVQQVDPALLESAEHEEIELTSPVEDDFDQELGVAEEAPHLEASEEIPSTVTAPVIVPSAAALAAAMDAAVPSHHLPPAVQPTSMPVPPAPYVPPVDSEAIPEAEPFVTSPPATTLEAKPEALSPPESRQEREWEPEPVPVAASQEPAANALAAEPEERSPTEPLPEPEWQPEPVLEPDPVPELESLPLPEPVQVAVAPAAISPADEQARWDAVAEEIRMQVLQRIDLFTDTGLREQLGRRLQPIVDRASADLVATINQHVGELLRAYVAEAIEREIEQWRRRT